MNTATAVGFLLLSASACLDGSQQAGPCGGGASDKQIPLSSGELVDGVDPQAWVGRFWGTHQGTLTWAAGGQSAATLTTSLDTTQSTISGYCIGGAVIDVYAYGDLVLTSADGGLSYRTVGIVGGPLPVMSNGGAPAPSAIGDTEIPPPWSGNIVAHLTVDLARYTSDSSLKLSVDWSLEAMKPSSARLEFVGHPLQATGSTDTILVASIVF